MGKQSGEVIDLPVKVLPQELGLEYELATARVTAWRMRLQALQDKVRWLDQEAARIAQQKADLVGTMQMMQDALRDGTAAQQRVRARAIELLGGDMARGDDVSLVDYSLVRGKDGKDGGA